MNHAHRSCSRRDFLRRTAAGAAGLSVFGLHARKARSAERAPADAAGDLPLDLANVPDRSASALTSPVAISRCTAYEPDALKKSLLEAFDLVGGIKPFVSGKTVTVKLNTTGHGRQKMCGLPSERTYQVHPRMVQVLCGLLHQAGAKRIVLVESFYENRRPEEILARQGWSIDDIQSAGGGTVTFADTRNRGDFKDYATFKVPYGGYVFPAYLLNRHYHDTDVFVSLAKLKNHVTAGVTCAVKNLFGIAPTSLYGNDAPNERTTENRGEVLHNGRKAPPDGVPAGRYPDLARKGAEYRVPRVTADLLSIRPVDLSIVDGVESVFGGEGPWCPPPLRATKPGLLIAGRNPITTDAVCTAVMGYDPQAKYGERPFPGENHLNLLARAGLGTNDLHKIEVRGVGLKDALYEYEPGGKPGWVRRNLLAGG